MRFFEIYRNADYLWLLAEGAAMSVALTVAAGLAGFLTAILLAIWRSESTPVFGVVAAVFVETVRNTPLIVQLFFIAFGLPLLLGYQWPFWGHALLALALNFSAYFSEILRAGFVGVPSNQLEAANALGLPPRKAFWLIVFPQAVANMYPALNSQFIFLFLTTGVISEIGVRDLTFAGQFIDSRNFRSFEIFFTLTLIYILLSLLFKFALKLVHDWRFRWKAHA
ncbi:MAG: amino acid ABC transporter permease [Rhodobacteraceae bacterium]|nr:amino acid ABC transporter permease [Paracoccaceae bacterium]